MDRTLFTCAVTVAAAGALSIAGAQQAPLIEGGVAAADGEFPFQVALISSNPPLADCGGVIVREEWVLTAYHCVMDRKVMVKAGSNSLDDTRYPAREVIEVRRHPNFGIDPRSTERERRYFNDLALLKVKEPFQLDNHRFAKIKLAESAAEESTLLGSYPKFVAGWGNKKLNKSVKDLQRAEVRPVDLSSCRAAYPEAEVRSNNLCSGDARRNHCTGDSGGPYVANLGPNARLLGIISWGDLCGMDRPGVHTRALSFRQWIYRCIDGDCSDTLNPKVAR